jgi:chlorite dismutase/heme-degrading monooxygenase HmoA
MPDRRDPPPTEEGWYALHDFRRIDWDAWRDAPERTREHALSEASEHLEDRLAVTDAEAGASALYSILGHDADLLVLHLRPTTAHIDALQRQFERTAFAEFTERAASFVSVTEASGYSERAREYFEGDLDENSGLASYIHTRLEPQIPDATHVSFYPMDKRRDPEQNWYDLPFEERAEHMDAHGDIGRDYGGRVVQMITGAIALDDWEWGVTLWGDDLTDMKDLLYEMRFDPSTSKYAEFGSFYVGRRFPPADLPALLAGDPVPTGADGTGDLDGAIHPADADGTAGTPTGDASEGGGEAESSGAAATADAGGSGTADAGESGTADAARSGTDAESGSGGAMPDSDVPDGVETIEDDAMVGRLATLGFRENEDYPSGAYGLAVYSTADAQQLAEEVDGLRGNFEHYDTHVLTSVRATQGQSVVVSIWETERAAGIAESFMTDLSGVSRSVSGSLGEAADDATGAEHEQGSEGHAAGTSSNMREELADLDVYAGQPHGEDVYALVLYSTAAVDRLREAVAELADGFDRYDTHEGTAVYEDSDGDRAAVVSLWATQDAARTASDHLSDLPDIVGWADDAEGFSTMGMFYTVKPEYREEFVDTFADVGEMLGEMDGHRETALLVNTDDENDMFIASHWDAKEDAMEFFRSDAFTDAVNWGREVLDDRPRHVFLA